MLDFSRHIFTYLNPSTLIFCFLIVIALVLTPEDLSPPKISKRTDIEQAQWKRLGANGEQISIQSDRIVYHNNGNIQLNQLQARLQQKKSTVLLSGDKGHSTAQLLTLHIQGNITGLWENHEKTQITLQMDTANYNLKTHLIKGKKIKITSLYNVMRGNAFVFDDNGNFKMKGNIRAIYMPN